MIKFDLQNVSSKLVKPITINLFTLLSASTLTSVPLSLKLLTFTSPLMSPEFGIRGSIKGVV